MTVTYDPETYLESTIRCLKAYVESGFDKSVQDVSSNDSGLDVYEIVMEFPAEEMIRQMMPSSKSMIHFELDDIQDQILSFGKTRRRSSSIRF